MEKKWYAVYTRPRSEKKLVESLSRKGIENYCPLNKVVRQWSDRKKVVLEPLFTSYVFVKVTEKEIHEIRDFNGVVSLVFWLGKPAIIRDVEIDMIRRFLNEHANVRLEKTSVKVNDIVKITSGPLMELEGSVLAVGSKTVKLSLPSLGYMMIAEVEHSNVEVLTIDSNQTPKRYSFNYANQ